MHPYLDENYARSSQLFESGFSGFTRLSITSLVWEGRLLIHSSSIARFFADVLHMGEKKGKKYSSTNHPYTQTKDVIYYPRNPIIFKIRDSEIIYW